MGREVAAVRRAGESGGLRSRRAATATGSGLAATDRVIDNPPESLADGDLVRIAGASAQKAGA